MLPGGRILLEYQIAGEKTSLQGVKTHFHSIIKNLCPSAKMAEGFIYSSSLDDGANMEHADYERAVDALYNVTLPAFLAGWLAASQGAPASCQSNPKGTAG